MWHAVLMLQNTLNIFLGIYYICVFENKTKNLCPGGVETWKTSTIVLITCQKYMIQFYFWKKSFFDEKTHLKTLFNWTNENHTHDAFSIGKRKPVKSLLTCSVVIWPEQLNILFKDHFVFWHLIQDLFLKNLLLFFLVWWDRIVFFPLYKLRCRAVFE